MRLMILVLALCGSAEAQLELRDRGRGGEWLSWNAEQRTSYVKGFVDGHLGGFLRACNAADELFEAGEPNRLGDGDDSGEVPSARCLARRGEFAKVRLQEGDEMDVSAYTDVITAFYKEHGRCRGFPFALLWVC